MTQEEQRLEEDRKREAYWRRWGCYLAERQWGTVREDYSPDGEAWDYLTFDHALSRAYRWGEDGIAGISDNHQRLCFAVALWNEQDPFLKERLFGLTGPQGNHGEDCKEYYFYLDCTPTHSYMKFLYKYPQQAYPYEQLIQENARRGYHEPEFELLHTGVFDEDKYVDVYVEYAKHRPEDILIRLTMINRGPEKTSLHVLPTLWFRNTWSWDRDTLQKPSLAVVRSKGLSAAKSRSVATIEASHMTLGKRWLYCKKPEKLLFTENETNLEKLFGVPNTSRYVKDGINNYIVHGQESAVNPEQKGTKASAHSHSRLNPVSRQKSGCG